MILALIIIGVVLMALGVLGIWLAMDSPVQLQPYPAIAFFLGLALNLMALGGILL